METTERDAQQQSKLDLRQEDPHWVEELFPPHFTIQDLVEDRPGRARSQSGASSTEPGPRAQLSRERVESQGSRRRTQELYKAALKQVQHREEQLRRETLAKRISKEAQQETWRQSPVDANRKNTTSSQSQASEEEEEVAEKERCVWNEQDIAVLRGVVCEVEKDRWRLRAQLQNALEELGRRQQESRQLQGSLDEQEKRLALAKQEAARRAAAVAALQTEGREKDARLRALAAEVGEKAEDAARWRRRGREAKEEAQEARRERADLAWELERLREQQRVEGERQAEAARLEHETVLQGLQREVEEARAELRTERESHARSCTALELLRRHFSS